MDPQASAGVEGGTLIVEAMSDDTRELMAGWYGEDFLADDAIIAADVSYGDLDDTLSVYTDYYPTLQLHYGYGYAVDDEMIADLDTRLPAGRVAAGDDTLLALSTLSYPAKYW